MAIETGFESTLLLGDAFDFYFDVLGKAGDFDGSSGRFVVAEERRIDLVHLDKVVHVFEEDRRFEDFI